MEEKINRRKGGRKPKENPSIYRYVFRLTDMENAQFLALFEASGMDNKAKFITDVLFKRPISIVKIDKSALDFYVKLTSLFSQYRSVGTNYNQVVKLLYSKFSEKKAAAYLYKLEKQTIELARLNREMIELTKAYMEHILCKR